MTLTRVISTDSSIYKNIIESIIREYCSVTNPKLIIRVLNGIPNLEIDENGRVKHGATLNNLIAVVEMARKLFGPPAYFLARRVISRIATNDIRKQLPDELK
ncbi:MAG TPA: hypothetical protein EYP86_01030 [Candidatus Altiarchaeales archaeon]|nr:hypothetical protein [Candidatus Altiarchaeales archaeon]